MKIIRYQDPNGRICHGVENERSSYFRAEGDLFAGLQATREAAQVAKLLAPLVPHTIWCIGLNYQNHAAEAGMTLPEFPVVFAKAQNSIQNPGDPILLPAGEYSTQVDYECELVVIIGKKCKNVSRGRALEYVAGYTCGNDVSARDWQLKWGGTQWCRGKGFDTFAPLGPCLATPETIPDPNALRIQTLLNGQIMQDWNTNDMVFSVPALIEFLSRSTTLFPGTAIFTGTPQGVGMAQTPPRWLRNGDEVSIVIEKIGALTNPVGLEPPAAT
jgi:2-keto-4-pentenoate hydratase/2-oxohepta-3-ene-1,7-dioic acid hydratase in catechol pathway